MKGTVYNWDNSEELIANAFMAARASFGVSYKIIRNESRVQPLPLIRAIISMYLRTEGLTFQKIGDAMNRNHGTIIHHCEQHNGNLTDRDYLASWEAFNLRINA